MNPPQTGCIRVFRRPAPQAELVATSSDSPDHCPAETVRRVGLNRDCPARQSPLSQHQSQVFDGWHAKSFCEKGKKDLNREKSAGPLLTVLPEPENNGTSERGQIRDPHWDCPHFRPNWYPNALQFPMMKDIRAAPDHSFPPLEPSTFSRQEQARNFGRINSQRRKMRYI